MDIIKKNKSYIRKKRITKKWTQIELAQKAGVSLPTISKAEKGRLISDLSKQKIADALEQPIENLFSTS